MLRKIGQSFAAQFLRLAITFADRFLVVGVLLRVWGTETYADWALLGSFASLLSLAEVGLNIHYGNVLQKAHVENDSVGFQRMVSVALGCSAAMGLGVAISGLIFITIVDVPRLLSVSHFSHGEALSVLMLLGLATISRMMRGAISQIYRGRQSYARGVVVDVAFMTALIVIMIAAGFTGAGPLTMAILYLIVDGVMGWGLMQIDLVRRWPELRFVLAIPTRSELASIARQVRWLAIQQGTPTAWLQLPVVLLGVLGATGSALVSFIILRTLANLARQVSSMLSIASGIEIANVHYSGRVSDVARKISLLGRFLSGVSAGIAVWVALYGKPFVAYWSGRDDLFDPTIAAALFGAVLITAPFSPIGSLAILAGFPRAAAIASMVQLAVGLVACGFLAAAYGVPGAAIGLALGEAVGVGLALPLLTARHTSLNYLSYLRDCLEAMVLVTVWCLGVGYLLGFGFSGTGSIVSLLTSTLLWTAFGLLPALVASLPAEQRARTLRAMREKSVFLLSNAACKYRTNRH